MLRAYKNNVKYALLKTQSIGDQDQWENENFILYNIKGLRKSKTEYRKKKLITPSLIRIKNFFFFSFFELKKRYISVARVCTDLILLLLFADY